MDSKVDYADSRMASPRDLFSVLAPLLYNIYIHDLPDTISRKYGYADDLAIIKAHQERKTIGSTLSQDMSTSTLYLRQWRLKLCEGKTVSTVFHLINKEAKRELLDGYINTRGLNVQPTTPYLGVKFIRTLSYRQHLAGVRDKVMARSALIRKLVGTGWGASPSTLRTSALALVYAPVEYSALTWGRSRHTNLLDVSLNCTLRIITGCLQPTPVEQLFVFSGIPPAELRRRAASLSLANRTMDPDHLLHHIIIREETQPRLKSRRPFATSGKDPLSTTLPNETRPTGQPGCGQWNGNRPPAGCVNISPYHPRAAQDQPFHGKPGSNSIVYALELGASMRLQSRPADSKSHHRGISPLPSTKWSPWLD